MRTDKAKAYYSGRMPGGRLNCAQAVIAAFIDKFSLDSDTVKAFAAYGTGRAPGGECGALYAAKFILNNGYKDKTAEFEKEFLSKAGALTCKEIRKAKKLPCLGCVEAASEFLEKTGPKEASCGAQEDFFAGPAFSVERQIRIIAGAMILTGILLAMFANPWFIAISIFVSCGLIYAGVTDNCMMGMLLMKMPWNRK